MRHRKRRSKLGMMTAHRNATLRNMVRSLIKYQRIETTLARAKELRRLADKLITLTKSNDVTSRRRAYSVLSDRDLVGVLFGEIADLCKARASGFTRIIPLGYRRGDGATLAIIELTDRKIVEKLPKKKEKGKAEEAKRDLKKDAGRKEAPDIKKDQEEHKKEESKLKAIPKAKPSLEEEKMVEKARSEERKIADQRGFMKNIRGLFRKRGDR